MENIQLNSSPQAAAASSDANDDKKLKNGGGDYGTSQSESSDEKQNKPQPVEFLSCRRILHVMIFLGFAVAYMLRVSLSEAIVAMVNQTAVRENSLTIISNVSDDSQCPRDPELQRGNGEFIWDRNQQATVLAAFYYGYVLTQIFGGWLADRVGGRWLFGGGILGCAALTLLTSAAAHLQIAGVIVLRMLEGMFEGFMFPATHALLSRWTPQSQTTRSVTIAFSGQECGMVVGILLSGVLCDHGFAGGWPSVFYVFGTIGCVWSLAWFVLCHNSPNTHPRISAAEREYLHALIGRTDVEKARTPWRRIFTSGPVLACCLAKFAHSWGYHTILDGLPLFYFDVLGFNMTKNGILASLPFLAAFIMLLAAGQLADWLRAPGRLSTTVVRKIFISCGLILPGVFFITSGFLGCHKALVVLTMITALGCSAPAWASVTVNSLDLSVTHAATLLGIANTTATLAGIAAPKVFGALTYRKSTRAQWQKVFYVTAAVEWLGTIVYLLFGSGEPQDWQDYAKST